MNTLLTKTEGNSNTLSLPIPFSISIKLKKPFIPLTKQRPTIPQRVIKKTFKSASVIPKSVLRASFLTSPSNIKSENLSKRKQIILLKQKNLFSNVSIQTKLKFKAVFPEISTLPKCTFKDYVAGKCFSTIKKYGINKENKTIVIGNKERRLDLLLNTRKYNNSVNKVSETINYSKLNRTLELSQLDPYDDSIIPGTINKLIHHP